MRDRVLLPRPAGGGVGETGPEVDREPAVVPHGNRGAELAALVEPRGERLADRRERRVAAAVELGRHPRTISRRAKLVGTNQLASGTVYRAMHPLRRLPLPCSPFRLDAGPSSRRANAQWCAG